MRNKFTVWRNPNPVARYATDLKKYNELLDLHTKKREELEEIIQKMSTYAQRIDKHMQQLERLAK